jgi:hypothetical protein
VVIFADANLVGRGAIAVVMAEAQADGNGAINEEIIIPPPAMPGAPPKYAPATYTVRITDDKVVAKGTFTVLPGPPAPPSGPPAPSK